MLSEMRIRERKLEAEQNIKRLRELLKEDKSEQCRSCLKRKIRDNHLRIKTYEEILELE